MDCVVAKLFDELVRGCYSSLLLKIDADLLHQIDCCLRASIGQNLAADGGEVRPYAEAGEEQRWLLVKLSVRQGHTLIAGSCLLKKAGRRKARSSLRLAGAV